MTATQPAVSWVDGGDAARHLNREWKPGVIAPGCWLGRTLSRLRSVASADPFWDAVGVLAPAISFAFAISTRYVSEEPLDTLFLVACGVAALWLIWLVRRWRQIHTEAGHLGAQRIQIQELLKELVMTQFPRYACRATWFREDGSRGVLCPFARYDPSASSAKPQSRAIYPLGVSYTGLAWKLCGRMIVYRFPAFTSRAEMVQHYTDAIGIHSHIVEQISDRMIGVQLVVAYAVQTEAPLPHRFLGVLSIDFMGSEVPSNEDLASVVDRFFTAVGELRSLEYDQQSAR